MDLVIAGSTRLRAVGNDALSRVSIELSADALEVGVGSIVIDDPAGTDADSTGRQCKVSEGIALLSDGFLAMDDTGRGLEPAQPHREDTWQVQDANVLLYGKRFVNRSRPAETDRARVLAFAALDISSADTAFVLNTNTVSLPAKKYTGSDWTELMQDVFEATGKTIFLHDKTDGSGRCLHSHKVTEGHTCGLTISDVPSAISATTFAPHHPNRNRSAGTLANNVYGRDQDNRHSTDSDATSITTHDADGLLHQTIVEFETVGQADLDAKTTAYLTENKEDEYIYTCSIGPLNQAALRLIRPGDRITVTSQAMALSASTIRIAHMTLTSSVGADGAGIVGLWDAALELQNPIRIRGRRGAPSGGKPVTKNEVKRITKPANTCPPLTFDDMNRTNASAWGTTSSAMGTYAGTKTADASPGSLIVFVDSMVPTHGLMKLTHPSGTWQGSGEERIVGPGFWSTGDWTIETSVSVINTNALGWQLFVGTAVVSWDRATALLEVSNNGDNNFVALAAGAFDGMGFVDITLRKNGSTISAIVSGLQLSQSNFDSPGPDDDLVFALYGLAAVAGGAEVHFGPINYSDCSTEPDSGQTFHFRTAGDGTSTAFTISFPYSSIRQVLVSGTDVTPDATATDSTTVTFAHAPLLGATIDFYLEGP